MKKLERSSLSRRSFLKQTALTVGAITIVPRFVLGGNGFVPPSEKINIGIIGVGKQARGLTRRFSEISQVQILANSDVDATKCKKHKAQVEGIYADAKKLPSYNGCDTYEDYQELLARNDVDAVIVATPDHQHIGPTIHAMEAGKDVFCEKPLSHTIQEGRLMEKAARKYGRILQTGSMQRSWENFRHACELVRNGYVGKISKVLVNVGDPAIPYREKGQAVPAGMNWDRWIGPAPMLPYNEILAPALDAKYWAKWRDYEEFGGGIIADWGAHMFDIAQWGLGMDHTGPVDLIPPTDRSAKRGLKMIYANGIEMVHEDFERGWAVRFIGSEGSLDISRSFLDSKPDSIVTAKIKNGETRLYKSENHYQDWLDAIKNRTEPICPAEIGHRSASVCHLANIAYKLGRPLKWNPEKEKFIGDGQANKLRKKKYRKPYKV